MNNHNEVCLICRSSNVITDSDSGEILCSKCGITDSDSGEILCSKCGMAISDKIQENREELPTFFNTEQAKDMNMTLPTDKLVSIIRAFTYKMSCVLVLL